MHEIKATSLKARACKDCIRIAAPGRDWILKRAADLEELWDKMDEADFGDERIPYWVELWPASLALAIWLEQKRGQIAGKICLDLGCGLGFTALVGQWLGGKVVAFDYEPDALHFAHQNAEINQISQPLWLAMDWRAPALASHSIDYIWAGDILYEKRACEPVLALLDQVLAPAGRVWLADPGRGIFNIFKSMANGWKIERMAEIRSPAIYPDAPAINVAIWEARRQ